MTISTTNEMMAHAPKQNHVISGCAHPKPSSTPAPTRIMSLKSSASCECAKLSAHSRR